MTKTQYQEKLKELDAKRQTLRKVFDEAGDDHDFEQITTLTGTTVEKVAEVRKMFAELGELDGAVKEMAETLGIAEEVRKEHPLLDAKGNPVDHRVDGGENEESLGKMLMESDAVKMKAGPVGPTVELDFNAKTLFETTAGWAPEVTRGPRIVDAVYRPIQVTDVFPITNTNQVGIKYMEETTRTIAAAETAEGGTYPESAFELTERVSLVQKISHWVPVTDEQLEDIDQAQAYLERRMRSGVRERLDNQTINGDGVAPNLRGLLNVVGIQTQAKGVDPHFDAIHKAITLGRVTGRSTPGAILMHSTDWQTIALTRTADGIYIIGNPQAVTQPRLWGLPVIVNEVVPQGTALVGDFANYAEISIKRGVEVQVTNSHGTFFIEGKQAMRADMRAAIVCYRPAAFVSVTGL